MKRTNGSSSCWPRRPRSPSRTRGSTTRRNAARGSSDVCEVLEERERIAKELHDGVIQSLFAVGMNLQWPGDDVRRPGHGASTRRRPSTTSTARSATSATTSSGCGPGILADRQLDQALPRARREFGARTGVITVVEIDAEVAAALVSRAADVVQLVREALSNVGRHGAATTCRVSLRREAEGVVLEVDDDGRGFDVDLTSWGMGMRNLRDRVESLGGAFEIGSVLGEGTTVRVTLPA